MLHSVTNEIVDELQVVGAVGIDAGFAVAAAVAGVAARSHIARIDGTVDGKTSRAAAAADSLRPAVPGAPPGTPPVPPSTELSGNPTRTLIFWSGFSPYRMFTWQYAAFAPAAATRWLSADLIPGPPVRPLPRAAQVTGIGAGGAGFLAARAIAGANSAEPKRLTVTNRNDAERMESSIDDQTSFWMAAMITPERRVEVTSPQDDASNMNIARGRARLYSARSHCRLRSWCNASKARRQAILATTIEQGNNSGSVALATSDKRK